MQGRRQQRKRCDSECKEHLFSLKKFQGENGYESSTLFCPKYQRDPLPTLETHPVFNEDKQHYTSGFILGVDRKNMHDNLQHDFMGHQKLIKESLEKNNQICFPRPNLKHSKESNCAVCRAHYFNYYEHIASEQHRNCIRESLYNDFLLELCQNYRPLWDGAELRADQISDKSQENDEQVEQLKEQEQGEEEQQQSGNNQFNLQQNLVKRRNLPLLMDTISKRIINNKGQSIKSATSTRSTADKKFVTVITKDPQFCELPKKPIPITSQKSPYLRHRQKFFTSKPDQPKEDSQTVMKNYGVPLNTNRDSLSSPRKRQQEKKEPQKQVVKPLTKQQKTETMRQDDQKTPAVQFRKTELEPYNEYMKRMQERQNISGMHPTAQMPLPQMYGMYQQPPWSYPYYSSNMNPMGLMVPPGLNNPSNHSQVLNPGNQPSLPNRQPHKNAYIGNTNISINFPMYMYPPINSYPNYTHPTSYPFQHRYIPQPFTTMPKRPENNNQHQSPNKK